MKMHILTSLYHDGAKTEFQGDTAGQVNLIIQAIHRPAFGLHSLCDQDYICIYLLSSMVTI